MPFSGTFSSISGGFLHGGGGFLHGFFTVVPNPGDQPAVEIFGLGGERVRGAALPVGASAVDGDSAGGALPAAPARGPSTARAVFCAGLDGVAISSWRARCPSAWVSALFLS